MSLVFADTFYWIAATDPADSSHKRAQSIITELKATGIITTDEVLSEFLTFFAGTHPALRARAVLVARNILRTPSVRVVPQSRDSFRAGMDLYEGRPDKGYSLTDCISMQTMRKEGLTVALTNDRHFEQEGFRAAFRDD